MLLQFKMPVEAKSGRIVLAGDIGATKTNLALYKSEGVNMTLLKESSYKSHDYKDIIGMTELFIKDLQLPDSICFGVAGPVLNGHVKLPNLLWEIDRVELSVHFGIKNIQIINDLEANAYGLAMLNENDITVVHEGSNAPVGNAAIIAPGTGLGEAGLFWDGNYYQPFATEGGHCDFAPRNEFDFELYNYLQKEFGHVSWERLVSGPGIINIYQFLRDEMKMQEPGWLKEKFKSGDEAAIISDHINQSDLCKETMEHFIRYLANESANLVLKLKATGGLFIGGGIAPQIASMFFNNAFYSFFCQSGRLDYLLEVVPVKIILNAKTALLGSAYYGIKD